MLNSLSDDFKQHRSTFALNLSECDHLREMLVLENKDICSKMNQQLLTDVCDRGTTDRNFVIYYELSSKYSIS